MGEGGEAVVDTKIAAGNGIVEAVGRQIAAADEEADEEAVERKLVAAAEMAEIEAEAETGPADREPGVEVLDPKTEETETDKWVASSLVAEGGYSVEVLAVTLEAAMGSTVKYRDRFGAGHSVAPLRH